MTYTTTYRNVMLKRTLVGRDGFRKVLPEIEIEEGHIDNHQQIIIPDGSAPARLLNDNDEYDRTVMRDVRTRRFRLVNYYIVGRYEEE